MTAHVEFPSDPPELSEVRPGRSSGMSTREVKALVATIALIVCVVLGLVFIGLPDGGMGGSCGGG